MNANEHLMNQISNISASVTRDFEKMIKKLLDKCGLYYKCFCRVKSYKSVSEKIQDRIAQGKSDYKLQDLIGVRIVVYFKRDIPLCERLIQENFHVDNISKDRERDEIFKPQRINYVCKIPDEMMINFDSQLWNQSIDNTFEIQIRTIFSEGWHEIEHDFRYKCEEEWKESLELSRTLNGVFATLENCDWTIENLLRELAYKHYKNREWIPMLKNVLKMRIVDEGDMEKIIECFNDDIAIAKMFLRMDREDFLVFISELESALPMKLSTIVYLVNLVQFQNEKLIKNTPKLLLERFQNT